eukprot:gene30705-37960_t
MAVGCREEGVLAAKKVIDHLANVCFNQIMFDCNMSTTLKALLLERPELDVEFTPEGEDDSETKGALKHKRNTLAIKLDFELPFTTVAECEHLVDKTPLAPVTSATKPSMTPAAKGPTQHANRHYNPQ